MIRVSILFVLVVGMDLVRPAIASAPPTTTITSDDGVRRWILASWCQVDYDLDPDKRPKLDMAVYQRVGPVVVREVLSSSTKEPILLAGALSTLQYLQVPPGSFSDLIRPHLKSADWYVRCMAVEALGAIGSAEDAPWLVPLLDDQDHLRCSDACVGEVGNVQGVAGRCALGVIAPESTTPGSPKQPSGESKSSSGAIRRRSAGSKPAPPPRRPVRPRLRLRNPRAPRPADSRVPLLPAQRQTQVTGT